jgi:hypothetical protein
LVLDPDYLPETVNETDTFVEMQNFVFGVFNDILLTPRARGILHKHVDELDAQAVYRDLVASYGKGINAQITATSIETKLTLYLFATSKSKTCVAFLTTWRNLIYDLELINKFPLPDHQNSVRLKSAVRSQLKLFLGNVQLYSRTHVGKTSNDSDFEYVYDLMLEHATDIDQTDFEDAVITMVAILQTTRSPSLLQRRKLTNRLVRSTRIMCLLRNRMLSLLKRSEPLWTNKDLVLLQLQPLLCP